jgi:formylglycine-generating enzyme required for sulfatase activity
MDMRTLSFFAAVVTAASVNAAAPRITSTSFGFNPDNRLATIRYELADAPGIVTFDVETNRTGAASADKDDWISIGGEHLREVSGDVNRFVEDTGEHIILWKPDGEWPDRSVAPGAIRAVVTAWSPDTPPDYLVVDLVNPSNRWFYLSEAHFPRGGITNDFYRQQSIVMRKIPAAGVIWTMGLSSEDFSNVSSDMTFNAPQHYVKLTDDYYIGVFELTMGQVCKFTNAEMVKGYINKFYHTDSTGNANAYQHYHRFHNGDTNNCPAGEMTMKFLRTTSSSSALNWPACRHWVDPKSWLGKVRAKTGVDFDLPTEAQWEFACRAGTGTMTYSGNYSPGASGNVSRAEHLKPIAWYDETAGGFLHRVGTKKANGFGLYDMIGNIDELCLDWYAADCGIGDADVTASVFEDPQGPALGDGRVYRGSYCLYSYVAMYSAARHPKQQWYGARLMCPVGLLFPAAEKSTPAQ